MGFASGIKGLGAGEAALGRRVYRPGIAATDLAAIAVVNIFRVSVGNVMLTSLYGKVTGVIGNVGATELQLWHTPDAGPGAAVAQPMCIDSLTIATDAADTIYTITGGVGVAMTISAGLGVAIASFCTNRLILTPGIIGLGVEVSGNTGTIDWTLHYVPMRLDARVAPL